jgi:uncharacterized delta-60 repeat protein
VSTQILYRARPFTVARPNLAKRSIAAVACFAAILCLPAVARGQSAIDGFDPGANGLVSALAVQSDGKIVVGGSFTTLGGGGTGSSNRNYIGRLNHDGSLDTTFDPGANNFVETVAIQADGKILVGGSFTALGNGGTGSRNYLGRLNPDGSLDASFSPVIDGAVKALVVQADGKILVGGLFTTLGNAARHYIGRLNADGSLDTTFDPGANNHVFAIAVGGDGTILVGGAFTTMGGGATGSTLRNNIARLTSAGAIDSFFNPGANGQVFGVATQPDGKIVIGGRFTGLGGGTGITPASKLGRLNTDGSVDVGFNPGADNDVLAVVVQVDGKVLVGGTFTTLGGGGTGTTTRNAIGRLNTDGSLDTSFDPGATNVHVLATQADGTILVGGLFSALGGGSGTITRNNIGRLYADGSVDADFDPGADNFVEALAVQPDGRILVGGNFTMLGGGGRGTTRRDRIGRLNADGSLDTTFNPGANDQVNALALQPDGKILVGGDFFTMLGGGARNALGRLDADGSLDIAFDPGANGKVYALAVQADGKILVGGLFTGLGGGGSGINVRHNLGRLNPDGSLDTTFDPGANGAVYAVVVQADGKIIVGGAFTTLGGGGTGTMTRQHVGRLNADGSLDTAFDPGANADVHVAAVQPDGMILLGGRFTALGGGTGTSTRNYLGRLNADGSLDAGFNPGANDKVHALAVHADGTILVGGEFTMMGGGGSGATERSRIARLNVDGSIDPAFNPGASYVVHALAVQADGKVLTGGGFTAFAGAAGLTLRNFVARLANTESASQRLSVTSDGSIVRWARGGAGPEISRATFESSTDGATFTSLGTGTRAAGEWQLSGQSLTLGQNLFVRARGYHATGHGPDSIVESIWNAYIAGMTTCPAITVAPASLPGGTTGAPYRQTITQSGGSVATTAFAISSGALPQGLTLWTTGLLTGTPTQPGSFNFTLSATDGNGCGGSAAYTLLVVLGTPATITAQPQSQTVTSGQAATLTVSATGTATLAYQWFQGASGTTTSPIAGATATSFTTPALTSPASYWVRVSNQYGTADSNTATITVTTPPTAPVNLPPAIGAQPQSQTIASGQTAVLSVGATGSATLSYQWYQVPSGTGTTPIPGATASSYTTPALTSATSYWVQVSNPYGTANSNTATITVTTPPTITSQPQSETITAGHPAVLSVGATGSPTLTYQWYQGSSGTTTAPIAGATASSYTTQPRARATSYWVQVSNPHGTADSITATITTVRAAALHDLDGDRKSDLAVFRPVNGVWFERYSSLDYSTSGAFQWGLNGDLPISGDFDGDGKIELTIFRPVTGEWWLRYSSFDYDVNAFGRYQWGLPGDIPLGTDFDGDGKTDLAVWRPANGTWYIRYSSLGYDLSRASTFQWGLPGDIPLSADFDDDGKTDLVVWRPANGTWYIRYSSLGYDLGRVSTFQWGLPGDIPLSSDFDGDGKADLAVWRPANGTWYIRYSSLGYDLGRVSTFQWGLPGDEPLVRDFDGDGKTELAVYRPVTGEWWLRYSSRGYSFNDYGWYQWGLPGDSLVK